MNLTVQEVVCTAHCSKCELSSNLWLCLICGALGCGRQQFGGGGGNGHGLQHTQETGHSVAVKLGTIEPDGAAGMFFSFLIESKLLQKTDFVRKGM